jgi:hypothetical protein
MTIKAYLSDREDKNASLSKLYNPTHLLPKKKVTVEFSVSENWKHYSDKQTNLRMEKQA